MITGIDCVWLRHSPNDLFWEKLKPLLKIKVMMPECCVQAQPSVRPQSGARGHQVAQNLHCVRSDGMFKATRHPRTKRSLICGASHTDDPRANGSSQDVYWFFCKLLDSHLYLSFSLRYTNGWQMVIKSNENTNFEFRFEQRMRWHFVLFEVTFGIYDYI